MGGSRRPGVSSSVSGGYDATEYAPVSRYGLGRCSAPVPFRTAACSPRSCCWARTRTARKLLGVPQRPVQAEQHRAFWSIVFAPP